MATGLLTDFDIHLWAEGSHYRVSLRSKGNVDIGAVAKEFGGGGHKNAAGCSVDGHIDELRNIFVEKMRRAIAMQEGSDV